MSKIDYDLNKIRGFVFDVDGVLSPSIVPMGPDGTPARMANVKDGYVLQLTRNTCENIVGVLVEVVSLDTE